MSEILNEGKVEITVVYEQEERDSISFPLLPACPNTVSFQSLFAVAFFLCHWISNMIHLELEVSS